MPPSGTSATRVPHSVKTPRSSPPYVPMSPLSKLFIFEGFIPNGLQIRIWRQLLHIVACVKVDVCNLLAFKLWGGGDDGETVRR